MNKIAIRVSNNDSKEIIDYLVEQGYVNTNCLVGNVDNGFYYYNSGTLICCTYINNVHESYSKYSSLTEYKKSLQKVIGEFDCFKNKYMNTNKKFIGYKSPMDLFGGNFKKGDIFRLATENSYKSGRSGSVIFSRHLPKEIVETWEPVYEEQETKITIGSNNTELVIKGDDIYGRIETSYIDVKNMYDTFRNTFEKVQIAGYVICIDTNQRIIRIGCEQENNLFSLNEILSVLKACESGKKL